MPPASSLPSSSDPEAEVGRLLDAAVAGDARAAGRLISLVEQAGTPARDVAAAVFPRTGGAWVVGITGGPGAGKSTLIDCLVTDARARDERVAVVAVDPSSPFSGGAVLGDRVRMQGHATDPGVFVRSMATRGRLGGLAEATIGAVRVLDASGWPTVLVETVGAGQVELDVAHTADTVVVVITPEGGDSVQAAKGGLMEVADVFVVNKADRPGADEAAVAIERALDLAPPTGWRPPVVRTVATAGGPASAQPGLGGPVAEVWAAIDRHRAFLSQDSRVEAARAGRLAAEVRRLVAERAARSASERCQGPDFSHLVDEVVGRRLDPLAAADAFAARS